MNISAESTMPTPTVLARPQNTERSIMIIMMRTSELRVNTLRSMPRGMLGMALRSMTAMPTVITMPARTAAGIGEATGPSASRITVSSAPAIMPRRAVSPPALMLATVWMVAPAPSSPPKMAAMLFPMPCPMISLLGLCLVGLSATTEVSRESMIPSSARGGRGSRAPAPARWGWPAPARGRVRSVLSLECSAKKNEISLPEG